MLSVVAPGEALNGANLLAHSAKQLIILNWPDSDPAFSTVTFDDEFLADVNFRQNIGDCHPV